MYRAISFLSVLLSLAIFAKTSSGKEVNLTPDVPPQPPAPNEALKGDPLEWARENANTGRYQEACDILQKAIKETENTPKYADMAILLSENLRITGKYSEALGLMEKLSTQDPKNERANSLKGELMLEVGRYQDAFTVFEAQVKERQTNHRAWALRKMAGYRLGKKDVVKETADHFFDLFQKDSDYYYSDKVKDPMELAYIGLGIQDENPKDAFEVGFLLAEGLIKKRGLKLPEAYLWSGELALDKYSFDNAMQRFQEILKIQPNSPNGLAGVANVWITARHDLNHAEPLLKKALEINPNHIGALLLVAGVALEEDRFEDAKKALDTALAVNPNHLEGLATLTFYYHQLNQPEKEAEVEKKITAIHAKPSEYYFLVGQMIEHIRKFPEAPPYYKKAIAVDEKDWRGYYGLGMNISRQGAQGEEEGKKLVLKAFEMNRFNVWASNMISVLDKLIGDKDQEVKPHYGESKTKHFTLKFHNKEAEIVRPYLEEWAESAYDWQTKKFGFEPEGPLTIELMYTSDDNGARTVGLPILGILGVCFGKMCTVVSPREGKEKLPPFNWRRTLEHEFGHVMTLQATKFKTPRWYTEAFSTYIEDDTRVESDVMMIDAINKNEIKPIDKMNEYFRSNILMAYVHGRYVIEYIDKTFGFDAHLKAMKLFAEGKTVEEALPAATGKTLAELNKGELEFTKEAFSHVHMRPRYSVADLAKLELAANAPEAKADDLANLAMFYYASRQGAKATEFAKKALEKDPKCSDALNLLARQAFEKKDFVLAKKLFEDAIAAAPDKSFTAWQKLGVLYKKEGKTSKAIEALEKARAIYPRYQGEDNPHYLLPDLYTDLEKPDNEKALKVWKDAVHVNTNDAQAAKNGMKLAIDVKDWKAATEFAISFIEIDPYDLEIHQKAGRAYEELKDYPHAAREYHIASVIDSLDIDSWVGAARVHIANGNKEEAKIAVEKALEIDGKHEEAKALRKKLQE